MVVNAFEAVLQELGEALKLELKPNQFNAVVIKDPDGLEVQLEYNPKYDSIMLYAELGALPPGRYREDILREALKANAKEYPRNGIFAYSDAKDSLVIFVDRSLHELNGEKIAYLYTPFLEKAKKWRDALARGDVPVVSQMTSSGRAFGPFGIRP